MTDKQAKAIRILAEHGGTYGMTARDFADVMWPPETRHGQRNRFAAGFLRRLVESGAVWEKYRNGERGPDNYYGLTPDGALVAKVEAIKAADALIEARQ